MVGKDGPSSAQFAALWGALAKKYAGEKKIMFGLMNEPVSGLLSLSCHLHTLA